jgi:hypothetical protein
MTMRRTLPLLLLALAAACDETLSVQPINEVPAERAITDAATARAALAGAYDATQDDEDISYYGGDLVIFGDLPSDDVEHSGTFGSYLEADQNQILVHNGAVSGIWAEVYEAINRANIVIQKVPAITELSAEERDDIIGQAHFLRALHYHNLVKFWGGVPLRLEPATDLADAAQIARSTTEETYAQILSDLDDAESLISPDEDDAKRATLGSVAALRSRVLLYMRDWAGTVAAANEAEAFDADYALAADFTDLFTAEGASTDEDVFVMPYTVSEPNYIGYYYRAKGFGGRYEVAPTCALVRAFDADVNCSSATFMAGWSPTDERAVASIARNANEPYGNKYPTGIGDEDLHVIRFAEVLLNRAEANARLGQLQLALNDVNLVRQRAGLAAYTLATAAPDPNVPDQDEVLAAVWNERRLELAFEGHRWPDLVRTGRAVALLDLDDPTNPRPHQVLFPIPQREMDVAPNLAQNPGY